MNRIFVNFLFIMLIVVCSCERNKDATEPVVDVGAVIGYGTSFGECYGYCLRDFKIEQLNITFTASSWEQQKYPVKNLYDKLNVEEYNHIQSLVNFNKIAAYDDIIGCPDCADGGAEWLEVTFEDRYKKITFEKGVSLASIQPLLTKLRQMYAEYNQQIFSDN